MKRETKKETAEQTKKENKQKQPEVHDVSPIDGYQPQLYICPLSTIQSNVGSHPIKFAKGVIGWVIGRVIG